MASVIGSAILPLSVTEKVTAIHLRMKDHKLFKHEVAKAQRHEERYRFEE